MKVAFQGIVGAYSEAAAYKMLGSNITVQGIEDSHEVVNQVIERKCDYGILPVENSIVGLVDINIDLFIYQNIKIIGEVYLQIDHCLYGLKGSSLDKLKFALSHPIALGQCKDFLVKHQIKTMPFYDTAGSCQEILERNDPSIGAIAGPNALKHFNLDLLQSNIQSVKNNFTRFLLFTRLDEKTSLDLENSEKVVYKTSISFRLAHKPSALLTCLQNFAKQQLNLTKIQSRPNPHNPFTYYFFIDFIGKELDQNVQECLKELLQCCEDLKVIGSYPQSQFKIS